VASVWKGVKKRFEAFIPDEADSPDFVHYLAVNDGKGLLNDGVKTVESLYRRYQVGLHWKGKLLSLLCIQLTCAFAISSLCLNTGNNRCILQSPLGS